MRYTSLLSATTVMVPSALLPLALLPPTALTSAWPPPDCRCLRRPRCFSCRACGCVGSGSNSDASTAATGSDKGEGVRGAGELHCLSSLGQFQAGAAAKPSLKLRRVPAPAVHSGSRKVAARARRRRLRPAHALRTVWDDRHARGRDAGAQHRVLLAGVAHADHVVHIRQRVLEHLPAGRPRSSWQPQRRVPARAPCSRSAERTVPGAPAAGRRPVWRGSSQPKMCLLRAPRPGAGAPPAAPCSSVCWRRRQSQRASGR